MENKKICFVVGGSGGIGSEICLRLAHNGFSVAIGYNSAKEKALKIKAEIEKTGQEAICVVVDANDEGSVKKAIESTSKIFGENPLYLVYCPGDELVYRSVVNLQWEHIQNKINLFARGLWFCIKTLLPEMRKKNFGRIVIINSSFSWGVPPGNLADYIVGKYSQLGIMKVAAVELGREGVTFNSVSPGMTQTDYISVAPEIIKKMTITQNPMHRLAMPSDVANAVVFLFNNESSYLNGVDIPVAGGGVMR